MSLRGGPITGSILRQPSSSIFCLGRRRSRLPFRWREVPGTPTSCRANWITRCRERCRTRGQQNSEDENTAHWTAPNDLSSAARQKSSGRALRIHPEGLTAELGRIVVARRMVVVGDRRSNGRIGIPWDGEITQRYNPAMMRRDPVSGVRTMNSGAPHRRSATTGRQRLRESASNLLRLFAFCR